MRELPENKFGYLLLKHFATGKGLYVKANQILSIQYDFEDDTMWINQNGFEHNVSDTIDDILEQLENIHPDMR